MIKFIKEINKVDDYFEYKFAFTQEDVNAFAEISGDKNPIHLDEKYALKTKYKRRIVHGFLGGSVFSKVFGTMFPGKGTLYLNQTMSFYKPMFAQEKYTAKFIVKEILKEKHRALVETIIIDENDTIIIKGSALIQNNNI